MSIMKPGIKILKNDIGNAERVLRQVRATKLDLESLAEQLQVLTETAAAKAELAALADNIQELTESKATTRDLATLVEIIDGLRAERSGDLDRYEEQLRLLDDKFTKVDEEIHAIDGNIGLCQNVIHSVKEALDVQARDLSNVLKEGEQEYQEHYSALGDRVNTIGASIREVDERNVQQYGSMHGRLQLLEGQIPRLETELLSLGSNVERIEQLQLKINARLLTVMRMSLTMIGVLVAATVVLGLIFFRP